MWLWELCLAQAIVKYFASEKGKDVFQKLFDFKSRSVIWIHRFRNKTIEPIFAAIAAAITSWYQISRQLFFSPVKQICDSSEYGVLLKCAKVNDILLRCAGKLMLILSPKISICWHISRRGIHYLLLCTMYVTIICFGVLVETINHVKKMVETRLKIVHFTRTLELSNLVYYDSDSGSIKLFEFELDTDSDTNSGSTSQITIKGMNDDVQQDQAMQSTKNRTPA